MQTIIALFSRHNPVDAPQVKFPCPKKGCDAQVSEYDTNCQRCGSFYSACIASGQSIVVKEYYTCKTCKHKAMQKELEYLSLKILFNLFDLNNVYGWDGAESCENHGQKDDASWLAIPNTY